MEPNQFDHFSQRVLQDMHGAVLVVDRKGNVIYTNQPASRMLEIEAGLRNDRYNLLLNNSYNDAFFEAVLDAIYHKEYTNYKKVPYMASSGRKYVFRMSSSYLPGETEDDSMLVVTLDDETKTERIRQKLLDSSKTFTTFLYGFCIWIIIYAFWEFLNRPISPDFMTHGVELLGLIMLMFIIRYTSLSWHDLGVMPDRPKETILNGVIVAACAVAFLFLLKTVARLIVPTSFEPDAPFFDISRFGLRQILYFFTAGIQEFLARSVIQGNLKRIIVAKHANFLAIVLSSLIFAALHIHFGFLFMVGAAILAGLEGILYDKQQNIFGVWIVHWAFGVTGTLLCLIDH